MPETITCTPEALLANSKCYCFGDVKVSEAVQIYLLNVISGLNLTPNQLAENAKCFCGYDRKTAESVKLYLLCAAANAAAA